jgi:transcriptional regulator with XRE-family HTH domain
MAILNGKALKEARAKKGWTQAELSEATGVDISTISRIERDKPNRVQANTLKALAKALDVSPGNLSPAAAEAERDVVKFRIEAGARNALRLVAHRYGITQENIVEIAPLLFFIAAEKSLEERKRHLSNVYIAAGNLDDRQREIRHLPRHIPVDHEALSREEASINARDLFGEKVLENANKFLSDYDRDFDEAEQNPFVSFLQDSVSAVSNSAKIADSIRWPSGLWPRYKICAEEAARIVGNDADAVHAILCGAAALHEMPRATPQQRAEWANAEFRRKYGDLDDLIIELAQPSNANVQTSNSGEASS